MSKKEEKTDTYDMPQDLAKALHKVMTKAMAIRGSKAVNDIVNDIADPNTIAQTPKKEVPVKESGVMYKGSKVKEFLSKKTGKTKANK